MEKFEAELDAATAKGKNGGIPGAVVAVVNKEGKILYQKVSGKKGVTPDAAPITFQTTFRMFSMTKLLTSIAILQAVERGILSLDNPVDPYLPELISQPILTGTPEDFTPVPAKNSITLRHLLTHSSGLPYEVLSPLTVAWRKTQEQNTPPPNNGDVLTQYLHPRTFEAGEGWMYSPGLDWAGLLLGRATNSTLSKWIDDNIFGPLGMEASTFRPKEKPQVLENLMSVSTRDLETRELSDGPNDVISLDPVGDAGGVGSFGRAGDYVKVLADLLKEQPTLLKKETADMLFTPQFPVGSPSHQALLAMRGIGLFDGLIGAPHSEPLDQIDINYGLGGLLIMQDIETEKYYRPKGTLTWSGLPNLTWAINREKGIAIFYGTQILPYADEETQNLWTSFETAAWRQFDANKGNSGSRL